MWTHLNYSLWAKPCTTCYRRHGIQLTERHYDKVQWGWCTDSPSGPIFYQSNQPSRRQCWG